MVLYLPSFEKALAVLTDAFSGSDLPMKVDVVDWAATSDELRRIIEREYEVLQTL